jgi:hypothetical protein
MPPKRASGHYPDAGNRVAKPSGGVEINLLTCGFTAGMNVTEL